MSYDPLKSSAYLFAGLAMMLNIRLVYSAAPYALLRFKLPENLFSVFVRVMASSLELWCLPSMCLGNIMDFAMKRAGSSDGVKKWLIRYQSIFWSWCNFATFVILLIVYRGGGEQGNLTAFYWIIAASGFVFGIYMVLVYAVDGIQLAWYMIGENSFPMVTSFMHYVSTLIFGNRRKYNSDYIVVLIDIWMSIIIAFLASLLWSWAYGPDEQGGFWPPDPKQKDCKKLKLQIDNNTLIYDLDGSITDHSTKCGHKNFISGRWHVIPPSLMVLVGMGLVYTIYPGIAPGMIVPFYLVDKIEMVLLIATAFPPVIIGIMKTQKTYDPYVFMGNWGGSHTPACKSGTSGSDTKEVTNATLNLSNDNSHTLTLQNTAGDISTTYTVDGTQLSKITTIKGQTNPVNIRLTLKLDPITLKLKDGTDTLTASGTITITKTVTNPGTELTTSHTLDFTSTGQLKQENFGSGGSIIIGPGATVHKTLNLEAAATDGKHTNLKLELAAGTKPSGAGTVPNDQLTLSSTSTNNLQLEGGITGTLTYDSASTGSLTANITNLKFDPNEFNHDVHKNDNCCFFGKQNTWKTDGNRYGWHSFTILIPLQISLAAIFIHCLHYPDSSISRSIINQPKMSTALSIVFYMCHEIMLALGFPGIATDDDVLLPMQLIGAFLMVLLAFYSVGYITEYKKHDASQWPTEGMTTWNALCYWLKMARKITNKNFKQLFTTDLNIYLVIFIKKYSILCLKYTILQNL